MTTLIGTDLTSAAVAETGDMRLLSPDMRLLDANEVDEASGAFWPAVIRIVGGYVVRKILLEAKNAY